jgi:hypothetical protein
MVCERDTDRVREHIAALRAAGMSYEGIAERSGLSVKSIHAVAKGRRRISHVTRDAILGVTLRLRPTSRVPILGAARRLQALARAGYGSREIARMLGDRVSPTMVTRWRLAERPVIQQRYHGLVDELYWRILLGAHKGRSTQAAESAAAHGYHTFDAWTEETIDDPDAVPFGHLATLDYVDHVKIKRVKRREVVDGVTYRFIDLTWPEQLFLFREFLAAGGSPRTFRDRYRPVPAATLRALEETTGEDLRLAG